MGDHFTQRVCFIIYLLLCRLLDLFIFKFLFFLSVHFFKLVVSGLLSVDKDSSPLITRFQEYLEHDDVRYFTMSLISENIGRVHQSTKEVSLGPELISSVHLGALIESN